MSDVQLILLLSLVGGLLSLDSTAVLQVMLSQPLVAGSVAGLLAGDVGTGLVVGTTLQLVWIGALPVGAAPFPDGAVAGVAGVGTAAMLSRSGVPLSLAIASGIGLGLCAGAAGQKVTSWVRRTNVRYSDLAESHANEGDPRGVRTAVALALLTKFGASLLLTAAVLGASLTLRPLASVEVKGVFPTVLWAAPIAAAAMAVGGKARESAFIVAGFAAGLAIIALV